MGPIAATLLCYFEPEVSCLHFRSSNQADRQRAYALLVRLHDSYGMHSIFAPGFPGLLEAFYVQERLMEYLMPELYQSFVSCLIRSSSWHELMLATEHDLFICLGDEMVHYPICQYYPLFPTIEDLGCIVVRWTGCYRHHLYSYPLVI
jgi:hypothetical protein